MSYSCRTGAGEEHLERNSGNDGAAEPEEMARQWETSLAGERGGFLGSGCPSSCFFGDVFLGPFFTHLLDHHSPPLSWSDRAVEEAETGGR